MDEAKYSVNVPLPKASQYDPTAQITIRADHQEELKNSLDALFGVGVFDRVTALGLTSLLSLPTEAAPNPTPVAAGPQTSGATAAGTAPQAAPQPASGGSTGGASGESHGACPACGVGQLVNKYRKADGSFMGVGCNNYPRCDHMLYWAKK